MREIKFRVWDKKREEFIYKFSVTEFVSYDPDLNEIFEKNDFVFQQYTGLKDKNGREIYEGDILLYELSYEESHGGELENELYEVKFVDGLFVWSDQSFCGQADAKSFEVVGNVFENLELLKDE